MVAGKVAEQNKSSLRDKWCWFLYQIMEFYLQIDFFLVISMNISIRAYHSVCHLNYVIFSEEENVIRSQTPVSVARFNEILIKLTRSINSCQFFKSLIFSCIMKVLPTQTCSLVGNGMEIHKYSCQPWIYKCARTGLLRWQHRVVVVSWHTVIF